MGWVHCGTLLIAQTSRLSPETFSGFRQKSFIRMVLHQEFAPRICTGGTNLRAVKRCELPPRTENVCIIEHSLGCHLSPIANGCHILYLKKWPKHWTLYLVNHWTLKCSKREICPDWSQTCVVGDPLFSDKPLWSMANMDIGPTLPLSECLNPQNLGVDMYLEHWRWPWWVPDLTSDLENKIKKEIMLIPPFSEALCMEAACQKVFLKQKSDFAFQCQHSFCLVCFYVPCWNSISETKIRFCASC